MRNFLFVIGLAISFNLLSQERSFILAGYIKDEKSGEPMIFANISVSQKGKYIGVTSNEYGFYSIKLDEGEHEIIFSYIGYKNYNLKISLDKDITKNIFLSPSLNALDDVVVIEDELKKNISDVQTSVLELTTKDIVNIPTLFGQRDIIKTIQYFPGVSLGREAGSEFIVRGGSIDQNLILLDGARIYNPSHITGIFSVFNSDALKDFKLYKGEMPAEYGGAVSSVLDIIAKDGNNKEFKLGLTAGILSTKLNVELPIIKNKSSLIFSFRRTYIDMLIKLFNSEFRKSKSEFYFYDINLKYNYEINENNKIYFSTYFGEDVTSNNQDGRRGQINWSNQYYSFRWNHLFNRKLFSNTFFIYSSYNSLMDLGDSFFNFSNYVLSDYSFKQDFQYFQSSDYKIRFGLNSTLYSIVPSAKNDYRHKNRNGLETAVYVSNKFNVSDFSFRIGLRYSNFLVLTPGLKTSLDKDRDITKKEEYKSVKILKDYNNIEPRIFVNYKLDDFNSIKLASTINSQHFHRYTNSIFLIPFNVYITSTTNIKPQKSWQSSIGYFKNFGDTYQASLELYYKDMWNLYDVKDGGDIFDYDNIEGHLVESKGYSYGAELLLKKNKGSFTGWLSYTISKTERMSDDINGGKKFVAPEDKPHDFSIVMRYKASDRWTLSFVWVYTTGKPITHPEATYNLSGQTIAYSEQRNKYRYEDYHRMDIGANYSLVKTSDSQLDIDLSVYNVYGKANPFFIRYNKSSLSSNFQGIQAEKFYLFSFLPSFSISYRF